MLKIGLIGYGYWGPNVARNFQALKDTQVTLICDQDPKRLRLASENLPQARLTQDPREVFGSDVDIVAVITPVFTHYELASQALKAGKHVFLEKPFTSTAAQGQRLLDLAAAKGLKIMVDHTFLYTPAVQKIKGFVDQDQLGRIYYYDSTRVNLGLFQPDVNVIWDLAPHDFSILDYVIKEKPLALVAHGQDFFGQNLERVAYVTVYLENDLIAHFNFNWLSPVKVRTTLIGGDKKMLVWNDLEVDEKIRVYDKGVSVDTREGQYNLLVEYRAGDMWAPRLEHREALRAGADHFVQGILHGTPIISDGQAGLRVVRMLEACNQSLRKGGKLIKL